MSEFTIGQKFEGRNVEALPARAVVVDDRGAPHVRAERTGVLGYIFEDRSATNGRTYTLAWLPEVTLDLADREVLAQELLRVRTGDPDRILTNTFSEDAWRRIADWVLENFDPKGQELPLTGDGNRVRLIDQGEFTSSVEIGALGTISSGPDNDGDYYISWDRMSDGGRGFSYAAPRQLRRVA